jgi:two-component system phosphate regulon sensor histidine kinase PhoR
MREAMAPWFSLVLAAFALALLWLGGVGAGLFLACAFLIASSLAALWWWASDQPPPPASQRATPEELRLARVEAEAGTRRAIEATVEAVSLPLLVIDRHRILSANAPARSVLGEHVLGQDPRVALRHPEAVGLIEGADAEEASLTIRNLISSGSLWQLTRRAIGEERWVIEMRDRSAEADISRAHTDFVANASHELRTPLASVIGYVETLVEAGAMEEAVTKRFLGTVLREAKRMQNLVSDLMSLSQLEAEKHDAPTERLDMTALAARVVGEFPALAGEAARVEFARPAEVLAVSGDAKQLEQLLRNLIDNALKYGDVDKAVAVELGAGARDSVELVVSDRGAGIAPDHLPHLTRRFYRTDASRSRAAGGTGLGLAIVKHIVERHRGKLDITSKVGVGTKVSVRLPRLQG